MSMISKNARRLLNETEHELLFEGMKGFVRACHLGAVEMIEDQEFEDDEHRDMAYCITMGMIVRDMLEGPVRSDMTYKEYRAFEKKKEKEAREAQARAEKDRESKAAEESGYRII